MTYPIRNISGKSLNLLNFKENQKGSILYTFDLEIVSWGIILKNCSVREYKSKRFFSFAKRKFINSEGKELWISDVFMKEPQKDKLTIAVLNLISENVKD